MSFPARVKYILLTLLFLFAAVNFARTTANVLRSSKRLDDLKSEISGLEAEKGSLEQDIAYKATDDYVEERARNALNFVKPGEKVYVVPQVLGDASRKLSAVSDSVEKSNLRLWYELFF